MTQEKKFFSPIFRTYGDDLTKRWRIEWLVPAPGGKAKRCANPIYISGKTVEDRYKNAEKKIKGLRFDLPTKKEESIFDKVFAYKYEWKPKTVRNYWIVINSYLKWCGAKDPARITAKQFPEYLIWLRKNNHSIKNISKYRDTVYTFYNYAIHLRLITANPVLRETKTTFEKQSLAYFSSAQIEAFKAADIPPQLWLAIQLLYYCFIRPGEQRQMRISWINFENKYIEIPADYSKNGKTQKVAIPAPLADQLEFLKEYPNHYYVLSKSGVPGLVQISEKHLNNQHAKILDKLKIRGRYAFYSWKHTGAVRAVKSGINIKDLQLQLRHHSLDMVNEYLKNLGVTDSEDLRNRFPAL